MVEIGGIRINDAAQAKAYAAQGFIDQEELKSALGELPSGRIPSRQLGDLNKHTIGKKVYDAFSKFRSSLSARRNK